MHYCFRHSAAGLQVQTWKSFSGLKKHSKNMRNPEYNIEVRLILWKIWSSLRYREIGWFDLKSGLNYKTASWRKADDSSVIIPCLEYPR